VSRYAASNSVKNMGLALVILAAGVIAAFAHVVLDAESATEYLAVIGQAYQQTKSGKTEVERLNAIYDVGVRSYQLTALMNQDFQEHGASDPKLIGLILRRLAQYGVKIAKVETGYSYDFAAIYEYLRLAPNGERGAAAQLVLIRYMDVPDDVEQLQKAIARASQFLRSYPKHGSVASVELELAVYHLRLSRLLRVGDLLPGPASSGTSAQHQKEAAELFQKIVTRYPDSDEAREAQQHLASLTPRPGTQKKPK